MPTSDRSVATDLREVARVIYGVEQGVPNVNARFFQLSNGGYDTHSDQGGAQPNGQHYSLHAEVGAALKVFYDDLADMAGRRRPRMRRSCGASSAGAFRRTTTAPITARRARCS